MRRRREGGGETEEEEGGEAENVGVEEEGERKGNILLLLLVWTATASHQGPLHEWVLASYGEARRGGAATDLVTRVALLGGPCRATPTGVRVLVRHLLKRVRRLSHLAAPQCLTTLAAMTTDPRAMRMGRTTENRAMGSMRRGLGGGERF